MRSVRRVLCLTATLSLVLTASWAPRVLAEDFLRGDTNGDGQITIADATVISSYLFAGSDEPSCLAAADFTDDEVINLKDAIEIMIFCVLDMTNPPGPPYPEVGPDPTPAEEMTCLSYGSGSSLEDPAAKIQVLDVTVAGGTTSRSGVITLSVSSSTDLAGIHAEIVQGPDLISGLGSALGLKVRDSYGFLEVTSQGDWIDPHQLREETISIAFLPIVPGCERYDSFPDCEWIPAATDVELLEIDFCLAVGTPAGEYPLTISKGELVDALSGRAIQPALEGGTITVLADVEFSDCPPPPPPPPPDVIFKLEDTVAAPGGSATVPFLIESTLPSQGFSFSVDFDESVIQVTEIERLFRRPSGTPYEFQKFEFNNENKFPGNTDVLEGYLVGAAIISLSDTQDVLPPEVEVAVLDFHFAVDRLAAVTETELRFLDGALGEDGVPVQNHLIASGRAITPEAGGSFVFINGVLRIIPDGIPFLRGDSNNDGKVDVSDAISTLDYLFLGNVVLPCFDAADANDDGGLNLTDAVFTLDYLFQGLGSLPPPFPFPGLDPSSDGLRCVHGGG